VGQRLANGGYVVLLPDLFYRAGPYELREPKKVFAAGVVRGSSRRRSHFQRNSSCDRSRKSEIGQWARFETGGPCGSGRSMSKW
jgi:dienelactone hydrolase